MASKYDNTPYYGNPQAEQGYYGNPQEQHEMQNFGGPSGSGFAAEADRLDQEVMNLTELNNEIARLQVASRNAMDNSVNEHLRRLTDESQRYQRSIPEEIRALARHPDAKANLYRIKKIRANFKDQYEKYLRDEKAFRDGRRDEYIRQQHLVDPHADMAELARQAETADANTPVFQQAIMQSNRRGGAQVALQAARAREQEMQQIEETLRQLAIMFQDLDNLVLQQDDHIVKIEDDAQNATTNLDEGNRHVDKGIKSARNARKLKWWCLLITIIIIALAVGLGYGIWAKNNK